MACPCGKPNLDGKFSPYIGFTDKGYCFSCGKTFFPDGSSGISVIKDSNIDTNIYIPAEPSFIPYEFLESSMNADKYSENIFSQYLRLLFGNDVANILGDKYKIGTSNYWDRATTFYQLTSSFDPAKMIRTGKIIQYRIIKSDDTFIGLDIKRNKLTTPPVMWAHRLPKFKDGFNLQQGLFGEHLLPLYPNIPVAIVESEKTAIIASGYLSDYVWLAAGSLTNLTPKKYDVLVGRDIILFPDTNGYKIWNNRAKELCQIAASVRVSDLLERKASAHEKVHGLDLADYLLRFNPKNFPTSLINSLK